MKINLHIDELNCPTISSRNNCEDINITTITIPWRAVFKELGNL